MNSTIMLDMHLYEIASDATNPFGWTSRNRRNRNVRRAVLATLRPDPIDISIFRSCFDGRPAPMELCLV